MEAQPEVQTMNRDVPAGVPTGSQFAKLKYFGPKSQCIGLVLFPVAGCICPCLCPCDEREAWVVPDGLQERGLNGAIYVQKDECSHCGCGECASGTKWVFKEKKKNGSGGD